MQCTREKTQDRMVWVDKRVQSIVYVSIEIRSTKNQKKENSFFHMILDGKVKKTNIHYTGAGGD